MNEISQIKLNIIYNSTVIKTRVIQLYACLKMRLNLFKINLEFSIFN